VRHGCLPGLSDPEGGRDAGADGQNGAGRFRKEPAPSNSNQILPIIEFSIVRSLPSSHFLLMLPK
jgi:hypothetical protein